MIRSPLPALRRLTGRRALLAAFGLGLLSALALPPLYLVPVLLLAVPGLLALLDGAGSWKRAGVLGFAWGMGHHMAGLYWISHALLTDPWRWGWLVPVAVPGLAVPLALYVALAAILAWLAPPGWRRWLALAGAWTLAEMLRGLLFTGFPWNLMGTVWAFAALPLQGRHWWGCMGFRWPPCCWPVCRCWGGGGRWRGHCGTAGAGRPRRLAAGAAGARGAGREPAAGAGQCAAGSQVAGGPALADLPPLPGPDAGGCRQGTGRGAPGGDLAGDRQPLPAAQRPRGAALRRRDPAPGRGAAGGFGAGGMEPRRAGQHGVQQPLGRGAGCGAAGRLRQGAPGALRGIHAVARADPDSGGAGDSTSPPAPGRWR
ncbi:hypothetical protein ACFQU7_15220 [Pseudoroseomonas wenyumeiae]